MSQQTRLERLEKTAEPETRRLIVFEEDYSIPGAFHLGEPSSDEYAHTYTREQALELAGEGDTVLFITNEEPGNGAQE